MDFFEISKDWLPRRSDEIWRRDLKIAPPSPDLVTVIQGVRRCGKSTFLGQLVDDWKLKEGQCFFINFEDPRLIGHLQVELLETLYEQVKKHHPTGPIHFFFDEIQVVPNWQKWIRLRVDNPTEDCFIITGSNASLLSGEFSSVLTGRHKSYELYPLSWNEVQSAFPKKSFDNYLLQGGFPRALKEKNAQPLLAQYFLDITERDLRERLKAKSSLKIQRLIKMVFESVGAEMSLRKLAPAAGISADTASLYLEAAQAAYLLFSCPYFAFSEKQQAYRNRKYYAIDPGLRKAVATNTGKDLGKDFENYVFLELRKKYPQVYYWKGKSEVDFVVETNFGVQPIQVTYGEVQARHEQALEEFYLAHPNALNPMYITPETIAEHL